jgi:hypothetical protein
MGSSFARGYQAAEQPPAIASGPGQASTAVRTKQPGKSGA